MKVKETLNVLNVTPNILKMVTIFFFVGFKQS